jgi:N-acetylglucosaminyl-diphospho-decaprenol L-rhamnosyltransferase
MTAGLSVAVVSFNTREITLRCLQATEDATAEGVIALTLVDNGSTDGTVEVARREHPTWRIVALPENPGYGSALNRSFREVSGSSYLALNSDSHLRPDAIRLLLDFLQRHPECGLVGPALIYPDGRPQLSAKRFPSLPLALAEVLCLHSVFARNRSLRRFYYEDQNLATHPWVDTVSGAAMLIRSEAFRRIGGFDEGFRMYFEETDLCRRLHDAGYRVALCAQAAAIHSHGASTIQTSVRQVEYYLSYVRYFRKHHGPGSARTLSAAIALSTVARMLVLPLKYPPLSRQRSDLLRGKLAACLCLLGQLWRPPAARTTNEALP